MLAAPVECELGVLQGLVLRVCQCCGPRREGFLLFKVFPMGLGVKGCQVRRLPLGLFSITYSISFLWAQISQK